MNFNVSIRLQINQKKNKIYDSGKKKQFKTKNKGHMNIKNYKFERAEKFLNT
jgi:hypothetical protein